MEFPHRLVALLAKMPDDPRISCTVMDHVGNNCVSVMLESVAEAEKLLAELSNPDDASMWEPDAICEKYEALHVLRP